MRYWGSFCLFALFLHGAPCPAQSAAAPHPKPPTATAATRLPPFSGTWILNNQRSKLLRKIGGESKAIIQYDGKTWHYIHSHQDSPTDLPDQWQTTLVVDSPNYKTVQGEDIVFHSRITRQGSALLFLERGETLHGQKFRNTIRYTLEDDGNTLIEAETAIGPLGPQHNLYVLNREGSLPTPEPGPPQ
jgi:hypothetical protein